MVGVAIWLGILGMCIATCVKRARRDKYESVPLLNILEEDENLETSVKEDPSPSVNKQ
jgi:hypothetical protein